MKKILFLSLAFVFLQCSKPEPVNKVFTVDQLASAPRVEIPRDSLPEWLVEEINIYEEGRISHLFTFTQIAKGEWNEQIVYLIRCDIYTGNRVMIQIYLPEGGKSIYFIEDNYISDLSTSKNWVVIYELGKVTYPTEFIKPPKWKDCSDYVGFVLCKLQYAPRIEIPMESLPEWLVEEILGFEKYCSPSSYDYKQIARGEWNDNVVYLIRATATSYIDDVYNETGDIIYKVPLSPDLGDFSTSKNWEVIYECGEVSYPTFTIPE